jgi:hypothetical protein
MNPAKNTPATPPVTCMYTGWFRPSRGGRWQCLVEDAATYDEAWARLLDLAPRGVRHGEMYVGRGAGEPVGED